LQLEIDASRFAPRIYHSQSVQPVSVIANQIPLVHSYGENNFIFQIQVFILLSNKIIKTDNVSKGPAFDAIKPLLELSVAHEDELPADWL